MRIAVLILGLVASLACLAQTKKPHQWTEFVKVDGQPEPVPAEWVSTPEGKFAHSIKIPNPVPKDSGYRWTMSAKEYFEHLCKQEAGEFIFKKVKNVEGFYFARPPAQPTDDDLMDRRKLEAPEIERTFQLLQALPQERAKAFVNPPWNLFSFVEEPSSTKAAKGPHIRLSGHKQKVSPMIAEDVSELKSRYAMTWRGIKRHKDREHAIAGSEWIVFDLQTREVLAVLRDYGLTGKTRNAPQGIWWLNAVNCANSKHIFTSRFYDFVTKALEPKTGDLK
jgi:hypothetical protein